MTAVKHSFALAIAGQHVISLTALVIVMLVAVPSRADDVTFLDSTDTLDFSTSSARISTVCSTTSTTEACVAAILAPSGSIFESGVSPVFIGEADGTISDAIIVTPSADGTSAQVTFFSDPPEASFGTCSAAGGCVTTEDGTVQLASSIQWIDVTTSAVTTTDNVFFQSDLNAPPVPEPASLTLLGSGLLAIAGYVRRRRLA